MPILWLWINKKANGSGRGAGPWAALFASALAIALTACNREENQPPPPQQSQASPAPQLPRIDLTGLQALIDENAQQRRVLVLDFWATWCKPCVDMFPALHTGLKNLGDRVRVVSVTLDAPGPLEAKAVNFLERHHATEDAYLLIPEPDARLDVVSGLGRRWQDLVVPAILIYDEDGRLAGEHLGEQTGGVEAILADVKRLIDGE